MKQYIKWLKIPAVLLACLLLWRLWPCSYSAILPVEENSVISLSAFAGINNAAGYNGFYRMDDVESGDARLQEITKIMNSSVYRQNFRNLLPWKSHEMFSDDNCDGQTVRLLYNPDDENGEYVAVDFISSSLIAVSVGERNGFRFYHPANPETIGQLLEYMRVHARVG